MASRGQSVAAHAQPGDLKSRIKEGPVADTLAGTRGQRAVTLVSCSVVEFIWPGRCEAGAHGPSHQPPRRVMDIEAAPSLHPTAPKTLSPHTAFFLIFAAFCIL